jgi:hypothetical protein
MTRKIWLLNFTLLALGGVLSWQLRLRWLAGHSEQRQFLAQPARVRAVIPLAPLPPPSPASPADYVEVAQKMLFSKDRNPNVIVQPPPPPPPPPPMPALPIYYGQMALGQPVVLLAERPSGEQKSYHAGEDVGKFKVVAWDSQSITLNWDGKDVVRKLEDLAPKEKDGAPAASQPAPQPAADTSSAAPPGGVKSSVLGASDKPPALAAKPPPLGIEMGGGFRGCIAGVVSPAGTVLDGYKKNIVQGLIGQQCYWEKMK